MFSIIWTLDVWNLCAVTSILGDRSQAFEDGTRQKRVVDLLHETAERLSKGITPETMTKAKESGYSALLEAGGAMISRLTTVNTADTAEAKNSWRSFGAAVAGGLFTAASKRGIII